jgi:hypothetical protein
MGRRLALLAVAAALLGTPAAAWALVFRPATLPAAQVGVRYQQVVRITVNGHHPALGKDYPSYTVSCFGADPTGGYIDDCKKLPPGLKVRDYTDATCAPPLQKPACVVISGIPTKAGRYTFRLSAPDANAPGIRGFLVTYHLVVKPRA